MLSGRRKRRRGREWEQNGMVHGNGEWNVFLLKLNKLKYQAVRVFHNAKIKREFSLSGSQFALQAGFPPWIDLPGYIMYRVVYCENTNYKLALDFSASKMKFSVENTYFMIVEWNTRFSKHEYVLSRLMFNSIISRK